MATTNTIAKLNIKATGKSGGNIKTSRAKGRPKNFLS